MIDFCRSRGIHRLVEVFRIVLAPLVQSSCYQLTKYIYLYNVIANSLTIYRCRITRITRNIYTNVISSRMRESGERAKLENLLRLWLVESGWRDKLKNECKLLIQQKGVDNVNVDDLFAELVPKGRSLVPDYVKRQLLEHIRNYIDQHANLF
ncbi:hypothetical protein GJ496_001067 [Pomphorhynchus laevis]|nr:hypothetical protein GJ496_001067 [Pomphorhynchus laevis]